MTPERSRDPSDRAAITWRTRAVPSITGRVEVNLTVRDPVQSAAWYIALLAMETKYDFDPADGRPSYICLTGP